MQEPENMPLEQGEEHLSNLVCDGCFERNLLEKCLIACPRCKKAFCIHFSSAIDTHYCVNCMSGMAVTKEVVTKSYEHYNEQTDTLVRYTRKARKLTIDGLDWLFAQRRVKDLSDVELDISIEYHRTLQALMLGEQEKRRNDFAHRYASQPLVFPSSSISSSKDKTTEKKEKKTTTTVKKTTTSKSDKQAQQLLALLQSMAAKGVKLDALAQQLGGK